MTLSKATSYERIRKKASKYRENFSNLSPIKDLKKSFSRKWFVNFSCWLVPREEFILDDFWMNFLIQLWCCLIIRIIIHFAFTYFAFLLYYSVVLSLLLVVIMLPRTPFFNFTYVGSYLKFIWKFLCGKKAVQYFLNYKPHRAFNLYKFFSTKAIILVLQQPYKFYRSLNFSTVLTFKVS